MATKTITRSEIKKLREDFLLLMKNADVNLDYDGIQHFKRLVDNYNNNLKSLTYDSIIPGMESAEGPTWYANVISKAVWSLLSELKVPIDNATSEFHKKYYPHMDKETCLGVYNRKKGKWAASVKRRAREVWSAFATYFGHTDEATTKLDVEVPHKEQLEMYGFKVTILNANPRHKEYIYMIEKSLEFYKKRASEVFPWMVKHCLPLVISYNKDADDIGGRYERDHIILSGYWAANKNPRSGAKTIAHEMGHHIYSVYLSDWDRFLWEASMRSDYGTLDLKEVLKVWPENGSQYWIIDHPMKDVDPTLYMQIYICMHPPLGEPVFETVGDVEKLLANKTTVHVPKNPITVYASKNHEEAFCEAVGMLVAYGPRSVPEISLSVLRIIMPNIHIASARKVAVEYLRRLGSGYHWCN